MSSGSTNWFFLDFDNEMFAKQNKTKQNKIKYNSTLQNLLQGKMINDRPCAQE